MEENGVDNVPVYSSSSSSSFFTSCKIDFQFVEFGSMYVHWRYENNFGIERNDRDYWITRIFNHRWIDNRFRKFLESGFIQNARPKLKFCFARNIFRNFISRTMEGWKFRIPRRRAYPTFLFVFILFLATRPLFLPPFSAALCRAPFSEPQEHKR